MNEARSQILFRNRQMNHQEELVLHIIVRSYAENHPDVKLQDLLAMDAKKIFEESKYKPKK
jgi:hypothetical protein